LRVIKIISIDDLSPDGVSWYRNYRPLSELQRAYPNIQVEFVGNDVTLQKLLQADLIIMFRPVRPKSLETLEKFKNHLFGKKIILDLDDNLWRIPPGHPLEIEYAKHADTLRKIYALADGIWVSTEPLMPFVDGYDGRGVVIPNAVLERDLPTKPSPYKGIVCWRGSIANFMDINSDEAFNLFAENREKFNWWVMFGYWPERIRGANVTPKASIPVIEYMEGLQRFGFNVMWKPLQHNEFNDAKSNIAWIEATISGGICVTNYAGKPGWEWAVDKFTTNEDFIASQWQASREAIVKYYNLQKINKLRYDHIIKTLER